MPGPPPRQHKHERQYTPSTHSVIPTRRIWNDDYDGQMIFGDLVGLTFPDIVLQVRKNPEKPSPRKPVPTGERTRARCVTSAHATTCSTAVDQNLEYKIIKFWKLIWQFQNSAKHSTESFNGQRYFLNVGCNNILFCWQKHNLS